MIALQYILPIQQMINITVNNKQYQVKEAKTKEERAKGFQGIKELPENEGMLFYYDSPQEVSMWMKDTLIPLDIIFINDDQEVIKVAKGEPNSEELISCEDTSYVLELNQDSGVKVGDELEFEEDEPVMKVLFPDGSEQMPLFGGERIFSRKNTKVLIKKAKKADLSKSDTDYKSLGKYMFKCIKIQDERTPEYVDSPTKNR